jgi:hypothetical protein
MIELLPLSLIILYLVPFMIAAGRNHDSMVAILVVNVLFGWTVIGWIAVFFWALFSSVDNTPRPRTSFREGDLGLPEARRVKDPMIVSAMRNGESG